MTYKSTPAVLLALVFIGPAAAQHSPAAIKAVRAGDVAAVSAALAAGADPDAADADGATALMWAAYGGSLDIARTLVEAGATVSGVRGLIWVDSSRTAYYGSVLAAAAGRGHLDLVRFLVGEAGADVDEAEWDPTSMRFGGWTALQWAAWEGDSDVLAFLIGHGADVDLAPDGGAPPIALAVLGGHAEAVGVLGRAGADTDLADRFVLPQVPLDSAAAYDLYGSGYYLEGTGQVVEHLLDVTSTAPFEVRVTTSNFTPTIFMIAPDGSYRGSDVRNGAFFEAFVRVGAAPSALGEWQVFVSSLDSIVISSGYTIEHRTLTEAQQQLLARLDSLNHFADSLATLDRYAEAERVAWEALAAARGGEEEGGRAEDRALKNLGHALQRQGMIDEGRPFLERALALRERRLGRAHPAVAEVLNALAQGYHDQGDPTTSRGLTEEAIAIYENTLGPSSNDLAITWANLGVLLREQGEYAAARLAMETSLRIYTSAAGEGHVNVTRAMDGLASVQYEMGDYAEAAALFRRAAAMRERLLGPDDRLVAESLNNLAVSLQALGEIDPAQAAFERALAINEGVFGARHPILVASWFNLGNLLSIRGDEAGARRALERALDILSAAHGAAHPSAAGILNDLAIVQFAEGDLAGARSLLEEAVRVGEAAFGEDHARMALALNNLGIVLTALGDRDAGWERLLRAARIRDRLSGLLLPSLSAAEQREYVGASLAADTATLLSYHRGVDELAEAYSMLGGWKGLLLLGLRRQAAFSSLADDPARDDDMRRFRELRAQIAGAYRTSDPSLAALTAEKEALERRLAAVLPGGAVEDPWHEARLEGLRAALPEGAVFLDVYRHEWNEGGVAVGPRYTAVVVSRTAVSAVNLGGAVELDEAASEWRAAVMLGGTARTEAAALAAVLWGPIAEALPPGTNRAWVSPDGDLVRVAWAAAAAEHDATSGLLVVQVPSARALLALMTSPAEVEEARSFLLVGDVDFGPGYAPLPGTEAEVRAIRELAVAGGVSPLVLAGRGATPAAVSAELPGATYAHLATHGFFYGESEAAYAARGGTPLARTDVIGAPGVAAGANRNPLAESGLVLAGASDGGAAGALTAEELVGLDLSGTRLVVLSACETGRGAEVTGQGVLGLQASITAAGARALLMSLWKVPDESTAALMEHFYRGLWEDDLAPAEALRQAQTAVRSTPGWEAPLHWAAWVLSGEGW